MARYVVIDTETTGINFEKDRIVEIALVEVVDGVIEKSFQTYLNPGIPCSAGAQSVHKIDPQTLANAPTFSEVVEPIIEFIGRSPLVAHFADFDMAFLARELKIADASMYFSFSSFCTRNLAKALWPTMSCKLPNVCEKLEIEFDKNQAHSALYDANICAEAFIKLSKLYGRPGL